MLFHSTIAHLLDFENTTLWKTTLLNLRLKSQCTSLFWRQTRCPVVFQIAQMCHSPHPDTINDFEGNVLQKSIIPFISQTLQ